ncbi:DNA polymerase Y family protein [Streptomyces sp. NPDC000878]
MTVLCVRFEPPPMCETLLPQLLGLLGEFTPVVQALPPAGALLAPHDGVRGSGDGVRGSGRGAEELAAAIRARALSRHGVDCAVGIGPGPTLARLALGEAAPGAIRVLPEHPDALAELLASHSVTALPGATDATARVLGRRGLDTLGRIAAAPPSVLCGLLGTETGRDLHDKASGVDRGRVVPNTLPAHRLTAERALSATEYEHTALRSAAEELGARLRALEKTCRTLTLALRYADHPAETRSRTLRESTAHSPALTRAAHGMYEALTPQPARVHGLALHAEELASAELRPRGSGAQYHSNRTPPKVFTDA